MIKCWPLDGDPEAVGYPISAQDSGTAGGDGRYITFAGIHTIHHRDKGDAAVVTQAEASVKTTTHGSCDLK